MFQTPRKPGMPWVPGRPSAQRSRTRPSPAGQQDQFGSLNASLLYCPGVEWLHRPESACFSSFPPEISTNISVRNGGPPPGQRPRILKNPFTLSLHHLRYPE